MSSYTDKEVEDFLSIANWHLGSGEYSKNKKSDLLQDFCKAIMIGKQIQMENQGLKKLIEEL